MNAAARIANAVAFDIPNYQVAFIRLFEYEERGTSKAYRIGRVVAIARSTLLEFEAAFRERFGDLPLLE